MTKQVPDVLTLNEVAEYQRIPRSTAYKLAQEGKIPGQKVGRHWRFHRVVIDKWLGDRDAPKTSELDGEQTRD